MNIYTKLTEANISKSIEKLENHRNNVIILLILIQLLKVRQEVEKYSDNEENLFV